MNKRTFPAAVYGFINIIRPSASEAPLVEQLRGGSQRATEGVVGEGFGSSTGDPTGEGSDAIRFRPFGKAGGAPRSGHPPSTCRGFLV